MLDRFERHAGAAFEGVPFMLRFAPLHRLCVASASCLLLCAGPVIASDYSHECEPVGAERGYDLKVKKGDLEFVRKGSKDPISPDKLTKLRLTENAGYCNTEAGRKRFKNEMYGVTVEFTDKEKKHTRKFRCELIEDELPAGLRCNREVRTIQWSAPERFVDYQ